MVQLLSLSPETWQALGQAQQNRVDRFIRQTDSGLYPLLRLAWNLPFLRSAAEERFNKLSTGDWLALGSSPFPSEWPTLALNALFKSKNWDRSNAIIRSVLKPSISTLDIDSICRVIAEAEQNQEIRECFAFVELLSSAVAAQHIGLQPVIDCLRQHNLLENVRHRTGWVPDEPWC